MKALLQTTMVIIVLCALLFYVVVRTESAGSAGSKDT